MVLDPDCDQNHPINVINCSLNHFQPLLKMFAKSDVCPFLGYSAKIQTVTKTYLPLVGLKMTDSAGWAGTAGWWSESQLHAVQLNELHKLLNNEQELWMDVYGYCTSVNDCVSFWWNRHLELTVDLSRNGFFDIFFDILNVRLISEGVPEERFDEEVREGEDHCQQVANFHHKTSSLPTQKPAVTSAF